MFSVLFANDATQPLILQTFMLANIASFTGNFGIVDALLGYRNASFGNFVALLGYGNFVTFFGYAVHRSRV